MEKRINGIDVSRAQLNFDFAAAKNAGVEFVMIRAGIRTDTDTYFARNTAECERLDIPYGYYWYCEATDNETLSKEIAACIKTIEGKRPKYPVFVDMEERRQIELLDRKSRTDMAERFCKELMQAGFPSGIYANPSWLENYYEKDRLVGKYDIWLAHWTGSPDYPSRYDYGQTMWQWGIDSIGGTDVDGNICFVDYPARTDEFYELWDQNNGSGGSSPEDVREQLRKGVKVSLDRAPLYISSTAQIRSGTVSGEYYIHSDGVINDRIRITTPEGNTDVTGWVSIYDCRIVEGNNTAVKLRKGDKVRVKAGALTYSGQYLAPFVYDTVFEVIQAGMQGYPDYIVIGINGDITAAMNADSLYLAG